ncbi:MAG: hypothetical protein GY862_28515, partial [Gammaproteobacteria bacterium]|nr:hypothetical protein [Gammaproteobacteria bacterium]
MSDETLEKQELFAELERLRREADDLKKSRQDLETRLETAVRQADIAEERLLKEQETAANKFEFAISTGGEILGLINSEIGMAQSLLNTDLKKEDRDWAEQICRCQEYVSNIVNDILDFLRIEAGKLELEEEPFDLRVCVEESLDCVASGAAEKGLSLTYMIAENTPDILMGDIARLRQILVELLNNAVKFTDSGEVAVSVTAHNTKTAVHEVHFAVRDTGVGISIDHIQRMFQSSVPRVCRSYLEFKGADLKLSMSKRLSELMGGRIWAESEKNKGSVFHFTIKARAG